MFQPRIVCGLNVTFIICVWDNELLALPDTLQNMGLLFGAQQQADRGVQRRHWLHHSLQSVQSLHSLYTHCTLTVHSSHHTTLGPHIKLSPVTDMITLSMPSLEMIIKWVLWVWECHIEQWEQWSVQCTVYRPVWHSVRSPVSAWPGRQTHRHGLCGHHGPPSPPSWQSRWHQWHQHLC